MIKLMLGYFVIGRTFLILRFFITFCLKKVHTVVLGYLVQKFIENKKSGQ